MALLRRIVSLFVVSHSHTCQDCGSTFECTNTGSHTATCMRCNSTNTTGH